MEDVLTFQLILILKDSCLEKVLLCKIEDNLVVVHLLSYKRKLVYCTNVFSLMILSLIHHKVKFEIKGDTQVLLMRTFGDNIVIECD